MSRSKTRDIIADLQQSNKTIKPESNKTLEQEIHKAIKQEGGKEKATFNLSINILEALDEACYKLKRGFKGEQRITKTLILETALVFALNLAAKEGEIKLYAALKALKK